MPALDPGILNQAPDPRWSTAAMEEQVAVAIERQERRGRGWNGRLCDEALEEAVQPSRELRQELEHVLRVHRLSGRARVRLLRIARTLADLRDREAVLTEDVVEAARLRGYERSQALG